MHNKELSVFFYLFFNNIDSSTCEKFMFNENSFHEDHIQTTLKNLLFDF